MSGAAALASRIEAAAVRRSQANREFFDAEAERLARCCHRMAERFARGGRLLALGATPRDRSDARHVAVEFVHPVIVGKRALPAIALTAEGGAPARQLGLIAAPDDIAIGFGTAEGVAGEEMGAALAAARERGCLTIGFAELGAEWRFEPPADDPFVRQELIETLYHLLWELVHVFFEHRGLLSGREAGRVHDTGASSFLYPFLSESEHDLDTILADVASSIELKAREVGELREQTLGEAVEDLMAGAAEIRRRFDAGGKLLAFGNGGSATDAMDLVADLREPPAGFGERAGEWPSRPALDLTEDPGILTAIANDVGPEEIFSRQVIAHGREGDVALALSTSGGSQNVIDALREARKRGMATIALVGYDGGRIAAEEIADHVIVTRSQHIPRIQEAQASALHVLRELIELPAEAP